MMQTNSKNITGVFFCILVTFIGISSISSAQGVKFMRDISPSQGIVKDIERPYRDEICLNGLWDFQPVNVPQTWKPNTGVPPELGRPQPDRWEKTKIKIPSPWNVNEWGGGSRVGKGTNLPYAPSSVYFPSYPESWGRVRMAWMRRAFKVPDSWTGKRIILHFEAVMGDFVVLVNGIEVTHQFGDYLPVEADITEELRPGENEILVGVRSRRLFDKTDENYRYFRTTYPPGSNTADLAGIWQDVFLFALPRVHIEDIFIKPWVSKDTLEAEVRLTNFSGKPVQTYVSGTVRKWINNSPADDILKSPEIDWTVGKSIDLTLKSELISIKPGETRTVKISSKVDSRLKYWSPSAPNLYLLILNINNKKQVFDCKSERFGWRQLEIKGKDFYLNGERIQCFGDIQHPFGAYICSRRFAWAWYKMIRDFGGNAVRPHAQPWPRLYYDLADEMGLMVIDEAALFGSSLSLNFSEEVTWERTAAHIKGLVLRDRNHPSVIGWSAGNELFAIKLYNKPTKEVADAWDEKIIRLAKLPSELDPTRVFITDDGDEDMKGNLPVWSKHFAEGLTLERLPEKVTKPLVVGEQGATYYGKPGQHLYKFIGEKAFESYYGRSEALAVDLYQNVVRMARPLLAYFSPSEVSWFGIEHLNLGYKDYSRLPDSTDGIFAGVQYTEGKPGYQLERIPPYVSTFNPGLDPDLPLYKPLPMFEALKSALSKDIPQPSKWDRECLPVVSTNKPDFPDPVFNSAYFAGDEGSELARQLGRTGIKLSNNEKDVSVVIIDGESIAGEKLGTAKTVIGRLKNSGGQVWIMMTDKKPSQELMSLFPGNLELTERQSTALQCSKDHVFSKYFGLPDLYFSELRGENRIIKHGMTGDLVRQSSTIFEAVNTDWSLFLNSGENRKCAQLVLYEHLVKPDGAALVTFTSGKATVFLSTLNYAITGETTDAFWKSLWSAAGIRTDMNERNVESAGIGKEHNLLMDGPVNK